MIDPVMADDGNTYERVAIECWLEKHDISPVTNEKFTDKTLMANKAIKSLIASYFKWWFLLIIIK